MSEDNFDIFNKSNEELQSLKESIKKRGGDFNYAEVINPYLLYIKRGGTFLKDEYFLIQALQQVYKVKVDEKGFSVRPERKIKHWFQTEEINTPQSDLNLNVAKIQNITMNNNERNFNINNISLDQLNEIKGIQLLEEGGEMSFGVDNNLRLHITQDPKDLSSISFALKPSSKS